jgi:hypothetical protein
MFSSNVIIIVNTATTISSDVVLWTESGCKEGPPLSLGVIRWKETLQLEG